MTITDAAKMPCNRCARGSHAFYISRNSNTSRGHQCILSPKYFPIASLDKEKSDNHNDIHFMAFAPKEKVSTKIVKEKKKVLAVAVIT